VFHTSRLFASIESRVEWVTLRHVSTGILFRYNKNITASVGHLFAAICLIETAFQVQSNPVKSKESAIPSFDVDESTTDEDRNFIANDMTADAS
jgi:hypothetical protein